MDKETVIQEIWEIEKSLEGVLPPDESNSGWSSGSQKAMAKYFRGLRERVSNGKLLEADFSIARGMDTWGIVDDYWKERQKYPQHFDA